MKKERLKKELNYLNWKCWTESNPKVLKELIAWRKEVIKELKK